MRQSILYLKNKFLCVVTASYLKDHSKRPFARRINQRHNTFWRSSDAEKVRNIAMSADDPPTKWKDGRHWQRKLSNKYNAKQFAELYGCKVSELFWKGRNASAINFNKLPPYYVIRPTIGHSCNLVFLMANSVNLMDRKTYSSQEIKSILSEALNENPHLEFLIEEFVRTESGEYAIPDDYKIYMFNGEVAIIEVINRSSPAKGTLSCYDKNWQMMANTATFKFAQAAYQPPPKCLVEMIEQAKRLSKAYEIFVRIDFYATDKGAVFGEFTPTPGAARFLTEETEKIFIDYWDTFCKGRI